MKDIFLIKKMIMTEKSVRLNKTDKYVFTVKRSANKNEIKKAVQDVYGVEVKCVQTARLPGKVRRFRNAKKATSDLKKAVVTLKQGQKIEVKQ